MAQQMTSGENGLVAPRVRDLVVMVFTDLDGTLLDHDTYAFDAARPALAALTARAIPVVPVTSPPSLCERWPPAASTGKPLSNRPSKPRGSG